MVVVKKKKRTKTRDRLLSINRKDMDKLGLEVDRLMVNEMKYLVNKYMYRYRKSTANTFGWNDDDLRQHIMIILWKGAATFDPERNVKLITYLSTILYYQMANLSKSCQNGKNSQSKMYFTEDIYNCEETTDANGADDWAQYTQQFKILMDRMTKLEIKVLVAHLIKDESVTKMEKSLKASRPEIISTLRSLQDKMEIYLGGKNEKNSLC